jgi:hypothetical protein
VRTGQEFQLKNGLHEEADWEKKYICVIAGAAKCNPFFS